MNLIDDPVRARRARRLKTWMGPVTAVAAVLALGISLVLVGNIPNARAVAAASPASSLAVPKYYVALPGADNFGNVPGATKAVVGDTFSGKQLLTVRPSGADKFVSVSAAADDRTFVLGAAPHLQPPAVPMATTWYLVRIVPGSRFRATVRKLRIPAPSPDDLVDATALSPDGRELALIGFQDVLQPVHGPQRAVAWIRVYSVATGALLHAWGTRQAAFSPYTTLSWTADGHRLAFGYTWYVTPAGSKRTYGYLGVRMLDVRHPGHDLIADSRLVWSRLTRDSWPTSPTPLNCALDIRALVTADGKTVVCSAIGLLRAVSPPPGSATCPAIPPWVSLGYLEFSTATGKQVRTLYKYDTNCIPGGLDVLWTSANGDAIIGYYRLGEPFAKNPITRFGIFSNSKFTPLPIPATTTTTPNAIAW